MRPRAVGHRVFATNGSQMTGHFDCSYFERYLGLSCNLAEGGSNLEAIGEVRALVRDASAGLLVLPGSRLRGGTESLISNRPDGYLSAGHPGATA